MKPILLFDIDGTLLRVKKSFLRELICEISAELNLGTDRVRQMSFAGRTDKDIFSEFVAPNAGAEQLYETVKTRYLELMRNNFAAEHTEPIDAAIEAVRAAQKNDIAVGLCTGNFREAAFLKVEAVGLKNVFGFGGFGCDYHDRNHLPEEAHKDFMRVNGFEPAPAQYVVIGDTPKDIHCARYFGAQSVAVATGGYSKEELRQHNPGLLVSSLSEISDWVTNFQVLK